MLTTEFIYERVGRLHATGSDAGIDGKTLLPMRDVNTNTCRVVHPKRRLLRVCDKSVWANCIDLVEKQCRTPVSKVSVTKIRNSVTSSRVNLTRAASIARFTSREGRC
jgi:hypothetical protein